MGYKEGEKGGGTAAAYLTGEDYCSGGTATYGEGHPSEIGRMRGRSEDGNEDDGGDDDGRGMRVAVIQRHTERMGRMEDDGGGDDGIKEKPPGLTAGRQLQLLILQSLLYLNVTYH